MSIRRRKEPIHQIFQICSQLTPDPTWKDFLNQCSYGYFPSCIKFNNGNLVSTRKKNSFSIHIPENPEQALSMLISIFRDRLSIKSVREKKSETLIFEQRVKENIFQSWSDVKTKSGKSSMLSNYVESITSYYCMNFQESMKALALLELCVSTGIIGKNQIDVSDGKITSIDGFVFDPTTRQSFYSGKISVDETKLQTIPVFYDPIKQLDFTAQFMNALKEHSDKFNN